MPDVCYFCGKAASSDEHVPPKALFPKGSNLSGSGLYRKNLITVRSCDEHNSAKSKDDEYLLYVLAMCLPSNEIGKNQFHTKVMRAIERKPSLIESLLAEVLAVGVNDTENDEWHNTIAIKPDNARLQNIFTHIAKAIYYHEMGSIWPGKVRVLIEFLLSLTDVESNQSMTNAVQSATEGLSEIIFKGDNPEVFTYQFASFEKKAILRLHFYENSKVLVVFN